MISRRAHKSKIRSKCVVGIENKRELLPIAADLVLGLGRRIRWRHVQLWDLVHSRLHAKVWNFLLQQGV